MTQRTWVVGDIHGCYFELINLINEINLGPNDKLISCGDLTEKGPDSEKVVDFFRTTPNAFAIKGNHEEGLVRFWKHEKKKQDVPGYKNPMKPHPERVEAIKQMSDLNMRYLDALPWFYKFETTENKFVVVHGGLMPNKRVEEMDPDIMCRLRFVRNHSNKWKMVRMGCEQASDVFWADIYNGKETVLFGHSPFEQTQPKKYPNAIGLDLAAVYGNVLCAYCAETNEYKTVSSKRYAEPIEIMKRRPT